jgi:hypothetical protein
MSWFARWKRKMRNYTSAGEYAGSHRSRSNAEKSSRTQARFEHEVIRFRDSNSPR